MISIWPLATADLPAARDLLVHLGYALEPSDLAYRYEAVAHSPGHAAIVAENDGNVVGLLHVYARPAFDKPPEAIVQALVVDQACRGSGVGKRLMATAETWAAEHGFKSVALASHVSRPASQAFYQSIGYRIEATSHLLRKDLASR